MMAHSLPVMIYLAKNQEQTVVLKILHHEYLDRYLPHAMHKGGEYPCAASKYDYKKHIEKT
jgi:hypothetical protein